MRTASSWGLYVLTYMMCTPACTNILSPLFCDYLQKKYSIPFSGIPKHGYVQQRLVVNEFLFRWISKISVSYDWYIFWNFKVQDKHLSFDNLPSNSSLTSLAPPCCPFSMRTQGGGYRVLDSFDLLFVSREEARAWRGESTIRLPTNERVNVTLWVGLCQSNYR